MARSKKSGENFEAETDKADTAPENANLTEDIQDAVILEEPDHDPESETDATDDSETTATGTPEEQSEAGGAPSGQVFNEPAANNGARGIFSMLLGGALVAAMGYSAAAYLGDEAWPFGNRSVRIEDLSAQVAGQAATAENMSAELASLKDEIAKFNDGGQETVTEEIETLSTNLTEMNRRLSDLENRPIPDAGQSSEAVAAYEEQLAGMRAMFEQELERIRTVQADAEAAGQSAAERAEIAAQRAGLAQVQAAIDSGEAYVEALDRLTDAGIDVPSGLSDSAETGVPTLADLQRDFPVAARAALNAAIKAQSEAGQIDPLTGFLKMQLGTRSLEPREGDDPDAILSRAEAALRDGNISRCLSELEALPEAGAAAMADWVSRAQTRNEAVTSVAALSDQLNN